MSSWSRTSDGLLYKFKWSEGGYDLIVTDLHQVMTESMSAAEIEKRGDELGCPFSLSSPQNMNIFLETIATELSNSADFDFERKLGQISTRSSGIEWSWEFHLQRLDDLQTIHLLGSLVEGLEEVVSKAADLINSRNSTIAKKDLIIRGLTEAGKRGVEYKAPMFLSEYLDASNFPHISRDDLLNMYWTDEVESDATQ